MDSLSDVLSCCRGLDTDKITERKKNAEKLKQLLGKTSVIKSLDRNTDDKSCGRNNNRLVTWDDVFKAVVLYIRQETASLQKGKESQSHTAQLNKEKKKQEVSGYFKFFVRIADKRGPRLKHQNILNHILEVLRDDYSRAAYGQDYSSILLKNILPVRKYWVEIRSETWHDLLNQYCHLYLAQDCSIDRVVLARLLNAIISGAARQCDLHPKKILRFFAEVFKNIRQEKGSQVQEHLLSALNVFVRKIAPSSRVQICELGETIFVNLLYLWNIRPTDIMKDEIVEFMQLQLQAHHPGGVKSPETGEFTVNKQLWRSHLRKLYEVMYTDLQQMGGRNRFTSGTRETVLKPAYVNLAADVCNQLFTETSNTIEVTQLSMLGDGDHSTPSKKRRLESGWTVVRDTLNTTGNKPQVIPWLQLVTRLIQKYPSSVPEEELLPLLQCLNKLLNDCKRSEILKHIFQCLIIVVSSYTSFRHITMATRDSTKEIWNSIWSSTLRSMSSHQAEAEGYQQPGFSLLAAIVLQKFVIPEKEVWNLFLPNVSSPNEASMNFLSICLSLHDLPENYQPSILGSASASPTGSYSLRKHLLDWIIPKRDASELSRSRNKIDPHLTCRVLTCLTVRNPHSIFPTTSPSSVKHLTELEKLYLETTFDCELRIEKLFQAPEEKDERQNVALLPGLLETLQEAFAREMAHFQNVSEPRISVLEDIISCSCVVTQCIQHLLDSRVVSPAMIADSGLEMCLKTMLRKMSSLLSDYVKKDGCAQLLSVILLLQSLFPTKDDKNEGCYLVSELLRTLLPGRFFDILFDIAFKKISRANSNESNSNRLGSLRRMSSSERRSIDRGRSKFDDIDAMDLEFDEMSGSPVRDDDGDDDDMNMDVMDDLGESQESDDPQQTDVCASLVNKSLLSESYKLRLEVVQLLCQCSDYEMEVAPIDVPYKAEIETSFLKGKLEELLEENLFDPGKAVDLLNLETIVRSLTTSSHKVSDRDLENMVDAIRQVARIQRREQEVCCLCLDLMSLLVPHLTDPDNLPSKVKKDCRDITLRLLNAFIKLRDDGQYAAPVRLSIAKCMQAFVRCDPDNEWSYLFVKTGDDEQANISAEFPSCILDGCHVTRSFMAEAIQSLFVVHGECGLTPKPAPVQHEAFDQLYENCNELMEIKGKMSPEKQQDERLSRTSSTLSVLATIACTSPISEKKAMFALCQLIRERNIEVEKVIKVLSRLSTLLGYSSVEQYMCSHLPFLICQWLELGYTIQEFPHGLLGIDSTVEFYKSQMDVVVPSLFMHGQLECIQTMATESQLEWKDVLKACTPKIVVHILPLFAASKSDEMSSDRDVKKRLSLASKCYDRLVEELTNEVKDKIIHSNLDMIVVNVLMCLHSSQETGNTNSCTPDPNPPSYNSYIIRSTLDFLTQSSSGSAKSLVSVLSKTQSSIQRVLLELASSLSTEHRVHEKQRILTMYQLFVDMLLPEFADELGGSWVFVLRDVVHRLLQVITEVNTKHRDIFMSDRESRISMIETCLQLLRNLCTVALECCPEELAKYLDYIVSNVMPFLRDRGPLQDKSKSLLDLLILENTAQLMDAVCKLDPFSEENEFSDYRTLHMKLQKHMKKHTIVEKLQQVLDILQGKQTVTESCTATLQSLSTLISSCRHQLLQITTCSEDSHGRSVFCQLLCELLHLTQSSCQPVALQAASCLGVIGPVNLSTLSLPRKSLRTALQESLEAYSDNPVWQSYCWIFHKLKEYLLDPCISVVKTSGEVLRSMLATKRGAEFSADYKTRLAEKDYLFSYLHPFKCRKPTSSEKPSENLEKFFRLVNSDILWVPEHTNHNRWVTDVVCALLKSDAVTDELLRLLAPICMIKPELCELVLPFLVHDILMAGSDDQWQVLGNRISGFFQAHCQAVCGGTGRRSSYDKGGSICTNKDSLQTMLNVVQYLRQQDRPRKGRKVLTPWDNNFWLDLNYLEIAKAAQYCSAPFTAILHAEIWSNLQRDDDRGSSSSRSQRLSQQESQELRIDTLSSITSPEIKLNIQELLLEAYQSVSDPDGVYGCGAGRLADPASRIKTYLHENRVEKAVVTYDIGMKTGETQQELGLLKTLQEFGADHLLELCLQGKIQSGQACLSPEMEEIQYEAAWRTGQWSLDVPSRCNGEMGFHQALYCAMDALKDDQLKLARSFIETARQNTLAVIDTRPESCRSIYPVLSKLHSLFHLQQIVDATDSEDPEAMQHLLEKLSQETEEKNDFEFLEPVWNVKRSALRILTKNQKHSDHDLSVSSVLIQQLHNMARFARKEGRYQVAERIIFELRQEDISSSHLDLMMEEAKLYWARDERNIAKHLMKSLIGKLEKFQDESFEALKLLPQALGTYGSWLAETRTENPTVILENYLEKTVELLESSDGDIVEAYMSLAQFVDSQYQNFANYMKSTTFEAKQALMRKAKMDAQSVRQHLSERDRYLRNLEKQGEIDEREVESLQEDRHKFLMKAVENYIKCLKSGDKHDLRIYRLTSLWFDNADSDEVNQLLDSHISEIKSYKFLPLMYQLAARMNVKQNHCPLFQPTLAKILETAAVDHPHHAVSVIMALAHANKDIELLTQGRSNKRSRLSRTVSDADSQEEDRVQAAKNLIERLKKNGKVSETVRHMEILSVAYIELANANVEKFKKETKPISLPPTLMLSKIKNLTSVAMPTLEAVIDPSGQYKDIVTLAGFADSFRLAGGINLPKILTVIGSDGVHRRQLVKGRDDLRQDAVMQQVFGMVNSLLKKNPETKKRNLRVRMYKVVPLSQRSGVLEWCEGTQPLGEYLIGSSSIKGAHPKYRPNDISAGQCREMMGSLKSEGDVKKKLKVYKEICAKFQPVFRHFFMERFSEPATWFEKRLAYTRSVATNSIVGYILGLGDRHVMNILIDRNSAELVHIDLGIAFEQGKILPTPETVPFRLTRDIVDGMGVTGVEGVFRRCCEKMMEVMHTNQESLLMILQVLLYDPLYAWSLSPQQALHIQNKRGREDPDASELNTTVNESEMAEQSERSAESQDSVNKMAERVLLRLQQKLQGIEDGIQLSVSGQVNNLIQEAKDPNNLCRLFVGWQPYL